jgi:hypothetical protein
MAAGSLYSFVISLDDHVSHSAKEAGEHVKTLGETVERASKSITLGVAGITNAMSSFKSGEISEGIQGLGEAFAGAARMLDLVVPGLGATVSALIEVGSLMGGIFVSLAQKGAELSLEAVEAKEKLETLFDAMGSIQGGKQTIQLLDNLSGELGITREKLAPLANEFLAMGYKTLPELRKQLTAAASAQALMGESGAQAYTQLAGKISATGDVLGSLGLKGEKSLVKWDIKLAKLGVNFDDLAKASGKTTKQFQDGLIAGTIKADEFGDALKDALTEKGEKPLEKVSESFDFLKDQAKSAFSHLFEDVAIKPFIDELKKLGEEFAATTPAGKALKFFVNQTFDLLFKTLAKAIPYVTKFFLQMIIWSLKAYIFLKHHFEGISVALKLLAGGMAIILGLIGLMAASLAALIGFFVGVSVVVYALIAGFIWLAVKAAEFTKSLIDAIPNALKAIEKFAVESWEHLKGWAEHATEAAANFIEGLVLGIESGISKVEDTVSKLGKSAADALKKALGIASPSKVMIEAGMDTGQGFADGLEASTSKASKAATGLAGSVTDATSKDATQGGVSDMQMSQMSPDAGSPAAPPVQQSNDNSSSKEGSTFNIDIKIDGAGKDVHSLTEEMVSTVFERLQLSQGL